MMKRLRLRSNQHGDTIVEVMIAMAVLGLVLVVSYATANHNTLSLQDAQERSVALKLAESQIEAMKAFNSSSSANSGQLFSQTDPFCMIGTTITANDPSKVAGQNDCMFDINSQRAGTGAEPAFNVRVTSAAIPVSGGTSGLGKQFTVTVNWDSVLGNGKTITIGGHALLDQDEVQMEYGLYKL